MIAATVPCWLADLAERYSAKMALRGVDGAPGVSHAVLAAEVARVAAILANWGIGRGDVALVALPDGPGTMMTILAVTSVAAALPVPEFEQPDEYARILDAANVRMVIMRDRPSSPLAHLAYIRGLTVVMITLGPEGKLTLSCARQRPPREGAPTPDDDAILVQTAGTTAQPKIVVISHQSLHHAAVQFRDWVGFGPVDRALCMMPAAHLHSFVRSTLPVLMAGGEVVWAPGFDSAAASHWVDAFRPTWIGAAPAIHRGLVAAAAGGWHPVQVNRIGVGSDRIGPEEIDQLATLFGARVFQFYGMTETTPFIAMTPAEGNRGPRAAVGRVNPIWQVTVLDEDGVALPAGSVGEIAVAGGLVNPVLAGHGRRVAIDAAGWLRTGDLGRVDAEGFLFVDGRVDDVINRGGEKIHPAAVEAVVESHPAVERAVVFGLPDPMLGARVAVVVKLAEGAILDEETLATYAGARLSRSMMPERFFFAGQIPVSGSKKVSRRMLADAYVKQQAQPPAAPSVSPALVEGARQILTRSLNGAAIGVDQDFFQAGGDSLRGLEVLVEIEQIFGVSLSPATFTRAPTATAIARMLAAAPPEAGQTRLDAVQDGAVPTLLFAYGVDGRVGYARTLAGALGPREGLAAFHARGIDHATIATRDLHRLADDCVRIALRTQQTGPFCLAGFSFGAHLALAIAQLLIAHGREVAFLGIVDDEADLHKRRFGVGRKPPKEQSVRAINRWAINRTAAGFFSGRITYFPAAENVADRYGDPTAGWGEIALGGVEVHEIEGSHHSFEQADGLGRLGPALAAAKTRALADPSVWARSPAAPDAVRLLRFDARQAGRAGEREIEIAACHAALAAEPAQPAWLKRQLATALFEMGDRQGAAAAARAAVVADPWPLSSFVLLAPLMRRLGRRPFLNRMLAVAEATPSGHPSVELWRADAFRASGDNTTAEATLRRGLRDAPRHLQLRLRLARVCEQNGRLAEAAKLLVEVVEDYPSLVFAFKSLGRLNLAMGEAAAAEVALRSALRLHDDDIGSYTLLAETLDRLGRPVEAAGARSRAADLIFDGKPVIGLTAPSAHPSL